MSIIIVRAGVGLLLALSSLLPLRSAENGVNGSRFVGSARPLAPAEQATAGLDVAGSAGLFIGINQFAAKSGLPKLDFAVDDAVALAHVFVVELKLLPAAKVTLALGGVPSAGESQTNLATLERLGVRRIAASHDSLIEEILGLETQATDPRGVVVVSVATHGFETGGSLYLMPQTGARELLEDTGVRLEVIAQGLERVAARKKLVLYDACRREPKRDLPDAGMTEAYRRAFGEARGFGLLISCDKNEVSWEDPDLRHGVFTHFLIEGLRGAAEASPGDGWVRLHNVIGYAAEGTSGWVKRNKGSEQTPFFRGSEVARQIPLAVNEGVVARLREAATAAEKERSEAEKAKAASRKRRREAQLRLLQAQQEFPQVLPLGIRVQVEGRLDGSDDEAIESLLEYVESLDPKKKATVATFVAWWQVAGVKLGTDSVPVVPPPNAPHTNSLGMVFLALPGVVPRFSLWETRVKDFRAFTQSAGYDARSNCFSLTVEGFKPVGKTWNDPGFDQSEDHPVCGVSWEDALAFCKWLTERERKAERIAADAEYRLPTDAEWSGAAGNAKYPWGEAWPAPEGAGNYAGEEARTANWPTNFAVITGQRDRHPWTAPVGSYLPNINGIHDMGGNVWEWVQEWYQKGLNTPELRKTFPALDDDGGGQSYRVLRGGSWFDDHPMLLSVGMRNWSTPDGRGTRVGFRCVLGGGLMR